MRLIHRLPALHRAMRNRGVQGLAVLVGTVASMTPALAQTPAFRPGFGVRPEQIARFETLRSKAQVPLHSRPEVSPVASSRRHFLEADLVRYEDGVVVVARRLDRKAVRRLRRLGVPFIRRFEDLRDNVIFDDRLYRVLGVAPTRQNCSGCPEGHLAGPDEVLLTRRVGRRVRLELAANAAGKFVVVEITTVEE